MFAVGLVRIVSEMCKTQTKIYSEGEKYRPKEKLAFLLFQLSYNLWLTDNILAFSYHESSSSWGLYLAQISILPNFISTTSQVGKSNSWENWSSINSLHRR